MHTAAGAGPPSGEPSPASGAWAAEAALAAAVPCEWSLADICPQAVPAYSHKDQHLG